MIFATSILTIGARLGLPINVVTTRVSGVGAWWLALVILRPLIASMGSKQIPLRLVVTVTSPTAAVVGLAALGWNSGDKGASTAQRFSYLYPAEDNAAWVSHAYAILRHGHLPSGPSQSGYFSYSALSSMPGLIGDIALRGRPSTPTTIAYAAVDVTVANGLLAVAAAAALLGTIFVAGLMWTHGTRSVSLLGVFLCSVLLIGGGTSILASSPALIGHASLAWADVALLLLGFTVVLAIKARNWVEFAPACAAAGLAVYAATGSWSYNVATPVIFAILLVCFRKSGLRGDEAGPIGHGPRVVFLAVTIWFGAIVAAYPQVVGSIKVVGFKTLAEAGGGAIAVEPLTLVGALVVGLGGALLAYKRADSLALVSLFMIAASSASAALVFGTGVLPGIDPTYSLTKSLYIVEAISPLAAAALLAHLARSTFGRLLAVGALAASALITTSPAIGSLLTIPDVIAKTDPATAGRLLQLARVGADSPRIVCQPSPYIDTFQNYLCNRWADALSNEQTSGTFRVDLYRKGNDATWAAAQKSGFLRGATIGDAAEIVTGTCMPPVTPAADYGGRLPKLGVTSVPSGGVTLPPRTGHIDTVRHCSTGLTIIGWAPFTEINDALSVWAAGPVKVISATRVDRPDVLLGRKGQGLIAPGFVVVLDVGGHKDEKLCLALHGDSSLIINGSNRAGCTIPAT